MDLIKQYNLRKLAIRKGFNLVPSLEFKNVSQYHYYIWMCKLQKWLREVHEIHTELDVHSASKPEKFTYSVSILPKSYGTWIRIGEFLTYEEALEKGLYEALKLIKK